jgi:uncharacterized protein YutE (UPF0331/DUF86 family)
MNRINDKIKEIEKYLEELNSVLPTGFEEYENDFKIKAICERYFERIIEAVVDLAFLVIKEKGFKIPDDDKKSFDVLKDEKIISKELCEKFKDAKGMRNIIVHEYGKIDNELVFEAVTQELGKDVEEFIRRINEVVG